MKNDLKSKIYAVAAAASRLERLVPAMPQDAASGKNDKAKAMNELIDAVKMLSEDARQLLEELAG